MQFAQIATLFTVAASVSAMAVERNNKCGALALCAEPPKGKCDVKTPDKCTAGGGTPYCCETTGLVNVLNCVNLLDGIAVTVPITLGSITLGL